MILSGIKFRLLAIREAGEVIVLNLRIAVFLFLGSDLILRPTLYAADGTVPLHLFR